MADNQGDFAAPLAGQTQQQVVNVASTVSAAALKTVKNNGSTVNTDPRSSLNLIPGQGISFTITDDAANDKVDVTVKGPHIESGVASWSSGVSNNASVSVVFATAFASTPAVVATIVGSTGFATAESATTTGATIELQSVGSGASGTVAWIAAGT